MKSIYYWFVLIVSIAVLVSSCSSEEDSKTASTDNTTSSSGDPDSGSDDSSDNSSDNSSSSSIPSCSTYDIGSTAVSTSGNGTISFGNKYVSGKYSNSWQGVTPSGGCIDNSSALSSWSDSVPGGTGSFKHKFIVTSNSSHTIANYWYSDSNCSTSIGYSHKKYNSITVGDNTTGLNENLSRPSYGYKVDKTYAASTLKGITDNATTLLNSWFSDYCTLTKGVEYNVPAGQTVYKAYWNTADSGSTDWFWMSPKGTSGYSDWSDNDNWYYPDNGSWQLIARQVDSDNFTDGTHELFLDNASTTYLQNENDNSSSTFMSIGNLTPSNYVTDGKYKFKLEWDGLTVASLDNKSVTWTQTSWLDNSTIAGFQEIGTSGYVDNTTKGFDGLMKSNYSTSCVIDGNQGVGWFHCVGAIVRWQGGIPGPKGKVASSMHLYIWAP
jgi:hypothetical protein